MFSLSKDRHTLPLHERTLPRIWDGAIASDPALAFVHIPKTAGSWFATFLAGHFEPHHIAPPLFGGTPATNFANPDHLLFYGHFTYARLPPDGRALLPMTFLRDPLARTVSQYRSLHNPANFTPEWRGSCRREQVEAVEWIQNASFDEFVRSENPLINGHIRNVQTNFLATEYGETFLSSAIANLERAFFFFGIQELSKTSLALFRRQTGSTLPLSLAEKDMNVSKPYDAELSEAGQQRLREFTDTDRKLYAAALRIFDRRVAESIRAESGTIAD